MHNSLFTDSLETGNESNRSAASQLEDDAQFEESIVYLKWVAYGIIAPILIIVGVVGNLLNLAVLTRPKLKGVLYTYLIWLAISDLMSLVFTIPTLLRFIGRNLTDYYSSFYHAHLELALVNAFMACSVFIVVAVTVDRYVSVSKPSQFKTHHTSNRARLWITSSYIGSFLLYIPVCFFKRVESVPDPSLPGGVRYVVRENFSVSNTSAWTVYLWVKESLVRLGPTVVLTFLNIMFIVAFQRMLSRKKTLQQPTRFSYVAASSPSARGGIGNEGGQREMASSSFQDDRSGLIMVLIGIVVMFVITMTPAAFLTLFMSSEKERSYSFQAFRAFANNMEFVNYAMNFYLYCMCSSEIRATFLRMFHFIKSQPYIRGRSENARENLNVDVILDEQATTTVIDSRI